MAYGRKLKTEMKGDTSRWGHRSDIKKAANKLRRKSDKVILEFGVIGSTRLSESLSSSSNLDFPTKD